MARATAAHQLAVVVVLVAATLLAAPDAANAILCGPVTGDFISCVKYARAPPRDEPPSPRCCSSVKRIAAAAKTAREKLTACDCLQSMLKAIRGINPESAAGIPSKCGVDGFPFAISTSVPCPDFSLMNRSTTHGVDDVMSM